MDDIIDADETDEPGREITDRYRAINYFDGDEAVTIIQERENDNAWIQSDLTYEVRT